MSQAFSFQTGLSFMTLKDKKADLRENLLSIEVSLKSVLSSLETYKDTARDMLKLESINKIRRYGPQEYVKRFLQSPSKNVSSHMRLFLYHKAMEKKLLEMAETLKNGIYEIKLDLYKLEKESESDMDHE